MLFVFSVMKEQPSIVLNVAHSFMKRLSPFVRQIDFTLDWMQVEAGRALFRYTIFIFIYVQCINNLCEEKIVYFLLDDKTI